ncbi:MAG: ABC transporter ATP-binding protein [Deltaproteobacteria bacterium]|nr:ABC transporter ATP-binding protein [Deltaproteobacteria bacterium]
MKIDATSSSSRVLSLKGTLQFHNALLGRGARAFWGYVFLLFLLHFYILVPPILIGRSVDALASSEPASQVLLLAIGLGASWTLVSLVRLRLRERVVRYRLLAGSVARQRGLEALLSRRDIEPGAGLQRISSGVSELYSLNRVVLNDLFPLAVSFFGPVVFSLLTAPHLSLFFLTYFSGAVFILRFFSRRLLAIEQKVAISTEQYAGGATDAAQNARMLETHGATAGMADQLRTRIGSLHDLEAQFNRASLTQWRTYQCWTGFWFGLFLWACANEVVKGTFGPGMVVTFATYFQSLVQGCNDLLNSWESLQKHRTAVSRLSELLNFDQEGLHGVGTLSPDWKELRIQDLTIDIIDPNGGRRRVVEGFDLELARGRWIGLAGPSGSGKTTIARTLAGLRHPTSGEILIDGVPLNAFSIDSIREHIALALQEASILRLSLLENIVLAREPDPDFLTSICDACEVTPIAERLPQGFDSIVTEESLSGGERQRVALARALCSRPSLVVLDEALSMVEAEREERILARLRTLLPASSFLIVSHHERSFQFVDGAVRLATPERGVSPSNAASPPA